jgi:hypothetical protein
MRRHRHELALLLAAVVAVRARAEDAAPPEKPAPPPPPAFHLDARVSAGYRMVDIDGSKDKYKEDYNLRSGGRLFDFELAGRASDQDAEWLDRFRLEIETPHDEPTSHFRLSASDTRRYTLDASFVRSKYFYEVPQLFEAAVAGDVRLDDLHDFDTTRTDGVVDFRFRLTDTAWITAGYRLYERTGDGVSTVFAPGGDTFLVRAPVDSTTNVGRLAGEFQALGASVLLQQEFRHVGRSLDREGPDGLGTGGLDPTDTSTLTAYEVNQHETIDAPTTLVRMERPIGARGEVGAAYLYQHASLNAEQGSFLNATRNVVGVPDVARSTGEADAEVDTHVADVTGSVKLTERVRVLSSYRFDARQQHGSLGQTGTAGTLATETNERVRIHRVTTEVEVTPRDDLRLRAGARWVHRDADVSIATSNVSTDALGAVADVRYRPWQPLDLFARYESAHIDDPYTSAGAPLNAPPLPAREIALTFVNRGSAGVRYRPASWAQLQYTFLADSRENSSFDARATAYGNHVSAALEPLPDLSLYAAFTHRDLDGEADIVTAPTYGTLTSVQSGNENVATGQVTYAFGLLGQRWSTGGNVTYVTGDQKLAPRLEADAGRRTFFDLDRVDGGAFLTLHHRLVEPTLEFRMIDYDERVLPRNDYRATMILVRLTRRFSR